MTTKLSVEEIKAVAEAAISARHAADAAKQALEDAGGEDETLKSAYETAELAAKDAHAKTEALSQGPAPAADSDKQRKIEKARRKLGFIKDQLRDLGAEDEEEDDEEDLDDPDRPVTMADLQRIKAREAAASALQMADTIEDAEDREAVKAALKSVVASGDPQKDFKNAVAIASAERNKVILEEHGRRAKPPAHGMGQGAPARHEEGGKFEPTAYEAKFMRAPFNVTKEAIIAARAKTS